jgi:hypothetical protein
LHQMSQTAAQPIQFPDYQHITAAQLGQHLFQLWSLGFGSASYPLIDLLTTG